MILLFARDVIDIRKFEDTKGVIRVRKSIRGMMFKPLSTIFQLYRGSFIGGEHHRHDNLYHIMVYEYTSPWAGFEITTLLMIGVDCIGSCKIQLPYDHHHDVTEVVK